MVIRSQPGIFKPYIYKPHYPLQNLNKFLKPLISGPKLNEYEAFMSSWTLTLVPHNHAMNLVGCKWVFKLKRWPNGFIERHTMTLVAKGFHQTSGLDFHNIFSPVIKSATICIVLSLVVSLSWPILQLYINNTFLNDVLIQPVVMQ